MTNMTSSETGKTPWHLWVVGVVTLLWNAMGAHDYLMTQTQNAGYMGEFTPEQLEYFYGFPAWLTAFWAIGVWGAVSGSVLLLLRKRWAVEVFLASLVAFLVTAFYNYVLTDGMEVMGGVGPLIFTMVIFLVAVGLYLYAKSMRQKGVIG